MANIELGCTSVYFCVIYLNLTQRAFVRANIANIYIKMEKNHIGNDCLQMPEV